MRIDYIVCPDNIADKIASKHRMTVREARQVLLSKPRIRFAEKGHIENNDVYAAFGQTFSGRYVVVFLTLFISHSRYAAICRMAGSWPRIGTALTLCGYDGCSNIRA